MTTINTTVAIPNFHEPRFFGVKTKPDTMIVEIRLETGDAMVFCITPGALKEFAQRCFLQAALHLGEITSDDDNTGSLIEGRTVN